VLINLAGQVTADGVDTDTLSSIENAIGSRFNDTIYGSDFDNVLDGGLEGSDQIFGGLGTDAVSYATSARAVLINLADQVSADGMNNDTLASIENAIGSAFGDTIISGAGASVLEGRGGSDTFCSGAGRRTATRLWTSPAPAPFTATCCNSSAMAQARPSPRSMPRIGRSIPATGLSRRPSLSRMERPCT